MRSSLMSDWLRWQWEVVWTLNFWLVTEWHVAVFFFLFYMLCAPVWLNFEFTTICICPLCWMLDQNESFAYNWGFHFSTRITSWPLYLSFQTFLGCLSFQNNSRFNQALYHTHRKFIFEIYRITSHVTLFNKTYSYPNWCCAYSNNEHISYLLLDAKITILAGILCMSMSFCFFFSGNVQFKPQLTTCNKSHI